MDASSAFTGPALTFGVTGEGVSFDPGTGLFSILTESLGAGVTVSLAVTDAEGATVSRYTLTLSADAISEPDEAPASVAPPVLGGAGRIGETVTLDPGTWSGTPAPALAMEWLIDGEAIPGATGLAYVPAAADDRAELSARVTARNAAGAAEAVTAPLAVTQVPPVSFGLLPDLALVLGSEPWSFEAGADFAGEALAFAVEGPGATIDAATGRLTLSAETAVLGATVAVAASNSGGTARSSFRLSVAAPAPVDPEDPVPPVPGAPAPEGSLAPLVLEQGSGVHTVSASALFSGTVAAYALEAAPEGVSIDTGAGLVSVATERFLDATVTVSATNAVGTAEQRFALAVRPMATVFDRAEALEALSFLSSGAAPGWTHSAEGFARLLPASGASAHGVWSGARGDGRYRCLARWSAAEAAAGFCFSARLTGNEAGFAGICVGTPQIGGERKLELRQYAGIGTGSVRVALADAAWSPDEWHWVEVEVRGAAVRARIYPEAAEAPEWQVEGAVNRLEAGAFGPGALAGEGEGPAVDIKRLEYHPLTVQDVAQPAAPQDGDWDLEQFTERT